MAKEDLDKDDLPFEIPEFNEDEFVRKELISFRTTAILFVFSLLVALGTFFLWRATGVPFLLLLVLALGVGGLLPFVYRGFRIDISHFRRREWIGTASLHFFFWLGFTLLLSNPPISDNSPPVIEAQASPSVQGVKELVRFGAYIGDNRGVKQETIQFCLRKGGAGDCLPVEFARVVEGEPIWTASWTPTQEGRYDLSISAEDRGGKASAITTSVNITNPFPVIDPANGTTFNSLSQSLVVRPAAGFRDLRVVQYRIGGNNYSLAPPTNDRPTYWTTNPTYPGWTTGDNEITIQALEHTIYLQGHAITPVVSKFSGAKRTYKVDAGFPDLGTQKEPELKERPAPNRVSTPAPDAAWLATALVVVAFTIRRTRRHA